MVLMIIMKNIQITKVEEMKKFLEGSRHMEFDVESREEKYTLIRASLVSVGYQQLSKKDKGTVKIFLGKVTGYEQKQMKRLIKKWKNDGLCFVKRKTVGASVRVYKQEDIALLIK